MMLASLVRLVSPSSSDIEFNRPTRAAPAQDGFSGLVSDEFILVFHFEIVFLYFFDVALY